MARERVVIEYKPLTIKKPEKILINNLISSFSYFVMVKKSVVRMVYSTIDMKPNARAACPILILMGFLFRR